MYFVINSGCSALQRILILSFLTIAMVEIFHQYHIQRMTQYCKSPLPSPSHSQRPVITYSAFFSQRSWHKSDWAHQWRETWAHSNWRGEKMRKEGWLSYDDAKHTRFMFWLAKLCLNILIKLTQIFIFSTWTQNIENKKD